MLKQKSKLKLAYLWLFALIIFAPPIDILNYLCYYIKELNQKTKRIKIKMTTKSKIARAKERISQKIGLSYTKKFINFSDPVSDVDYRLKIEEAKNQYGETIVKVTLPEEKNFFRGVKFSEKVRLEKMRDDQWVKILHAKFGAGADEMFGVTELHEESELEARDIRIIAAVEKLLAGDAHKVKIKKISTPRARVSKVPA